MQVERDRFGYNGAKKAHHMIETTMVFMHHGEMHIRVSTLPMSLNEEEVTLLAIEDITEAKKHEQILLEKEKLSVVLKTAGAVCHEINQPLMIISGLSDLLLFELKDGAVEKNLLKLKKQIDRLGLITKKLMKITKVETKPYLNGEIIDIDASSNEKDFFKMIKKFTLNPSHKLLISS